MSLRRSKCKVSQEYILLQGKFRKFRTKTSDFQQKVINARTYSKKKMCQEKNFTRKGLLKLIFKHFSQLTKKPKT